jgi:hypothetical protein
MDAMLTQFFGSNVLFVTARVTDEGLHADGDGFADLGETVRLDIAMISSVQDAVEERPDLEDVSITLISYDRDVGPAEPVACVLDGSSYYGRLEAGVARFNDPADPFRFVVGDVARTSATEVLQAEFTLGIEGRYVDSVLGEQRIASFGTPQRFAINLDLDIDPASPAGPLVADAACVGGTSSGRVCVAPEDCPGAKGDGSPATCNPLPAYLQAGGTGFLAGQVGYFEGFEGAEHMGGRNFTAGPWPFAVPGTSFEHSPAVSAAGGYLDGGHIGNPLDFIPGPLTPGASPGNAMDIPEGSSAVDGLRCQYNDPRGPSKHGRHEYYCRPWDGSDWHANHTKAFSGESSLYGGVDGAADFGLGSEFDTYHMNLLCSVFSVPIHIGVQTNPTLSIYHIISMADYRAFTVPWEGAVGRGWVEWTEVSPSTGVPLTPWRKLAAFQNNYASTGCTPTFAQCIFDHYDEFYDASAALGWTPGFKPDATTPVGVPRNADDVGSEDDYFDPNDPLRELGPSSSCFPEYVFSAMGDYTSRDTTMVNVAVTEGELCSTGSGVWVNSLFNLEVAAGKTIRLRFAMTDIDLALGATWVQAFGTVLGNSTRGWRLDDVAISGVTDQPILLVPDPRTPAPPACPVDPDPETPGNEAACDVVTAHAGVDLVTPVAGMLISLDASASHANQCVDGFLEYRWRAGGATLQDYSTNPVLIDTPAITTVYTLDARCSTDPACVGSDSVIVVPGDEYEVSGTPTDLCVVEIAEPGAGASGGATSVLTRWEEPPVPGPHLVSVYGVDIAHNGSILRAAGGQGASPGDLLAALRGGLCALGTGTNVGESVVDFTESVLELESGEIVGYLAVTTSPLGVVGSLGRGELIGSPAAFARGRVTPGSLEDCAP